MRRFVLTLLLVLGAGWASGVLAQTTGVASIVIDSRWAGLSAGPVPPTHVVVSWRAGHYVRDGKVIDAKWVQRLVTVLAADQVKSPSREALGLSQEWLIQHAQAALKGLYLSASPAQARLFLSNYTNAVVVDEVLPDLCRRIQHTDDYPVVDVTVTMTDGRRIQFGAASQAPFMLPWYIGGGNSSVPTWNADISRAVAALLPAKALNRERLQANGLVDHLAGVLLDHIRNAWDMAGATGANSRLMEALRSSYTVQSARAMHAYNDDFESSAHFEKHHTLNIFTTLHRRGYPPNFKIFFVAPDGGKGVSAPSAEVVSRYARAVLSTPWLVKVIRQSSGASIGIRIIGNRSLSKQGVKQFTKDMRQAGRPDLARRVRREADKVALLIIKYRGRWLVFPDHSAILWRAYSFEPEDWLGFPEDAFTKHDCNEGYGTCPAAEIDPTGHILSLQQ